MSHKISTTSQNHDKNSSGFFNQQNTTTSSDSGIFHQLNLGLRRLFKLPLDFYSCMVSSGKLSLRRSRTLQISALVSSFVLILAIAATLAPVYNRADITEAASSYASSSLSMNVTKSTASVDLSVIRDNGSFASSVSPIAFNITTTNYTGYTLSLKNTKSTKTLVNSANSNYTLDSITSSVSESAFSADTTSAATNYNGKWGYKPSKYNSSSNSNYLSLPTTSGSTLDTTTAANSSANSYTIGIGARAGYTQAAGTYTGTYTLVAIANNVPYTINYNGNVGTSGDTVGNLPSNTTSTTSEQYITISSNTPTRTGYTFVGWCTNHTTTNPTTTLTNGSTTCPTSATTLSSSGRFYIDQTTNNLTTLYAIWTRKNTTYTLSYNANNGSGTPSSQSNTNNNGSYTFTLNTSTIPTRSGYDFLGYSTSSSATTPTYTYTAGTGTNSANGTFSPSTIILTQPSMSSTSTSTTLYAVWEKLPDTISSFTYIQDVTVEACKNTTIGATATVKDSRDNQEYTIGKLANGKCWLLDNLRLGTGIQLTSADSNVSSTWTTPPSSTSSNFGSYTVAQINTGSINTTQSYGSGSGKIGIYYNYCAATAGTYCMDGEYGSGNASYDICPKGWRMPTIGEYEGLYNTYNSNATNFKNALRTPRSGQFNYNSVKDRDTYGYFWSSTRANASGMFRLRVYASSVNLEGGDSRYYGNPVRCVLKRPVVSGMYMQDVTAGMVADTTDGTAASLTDSRDDQIYTVAKIGNLLWMTRNLAVGCAGTGSAYSATIKSVSLTSSNSNVSSTWPTPTASLSTKANSSFTSGYTTAAIQCHATYGGYYNYAAATASTITGSSNSTEAQYSVCPSGWRLPTHTELGTIGTSNGSTTNVSAFTSVYSGYYENGSLNGTGSGGVGLWWSSTAYDATRRYYLYYNSDKLYSDNGVNNRYNGNSVRCVHP